MLLNGAFISNLGRVKIREELLAANHPEGEPDNLQEKIGKRMAAGKKWIVEASTPLNTVLVLALTQILEKLVMTLFATSDVTVNRDYKVSSKTGAKRRRLNKCAAPAPDAGNLGAQHVAAPQEKPKSSNVHRVMRRCSETIHELWAVLRNPEARERSPLNLAKYWASDVTPTEFMKK